MCQLLTCGEREAIGLYYSLLFDENLLLKVERQLQANERFGLNDIKIVSRRKKNVVGALTLDSMLHIAQEVKSRSVPHSVAGPLEEDDESMPAASSTAVCLSYHKVAFAVATRSIEA